MPLALLLFYLVRWSNVLVSVSTTRSLNQEVIQVHIHFEITKSNQVVEFLLFVSTSNDTSLG